MYTVELRPGVDEMNGEEVSRRQVLRAAAVTGTAGVASGAATHALLADDETADENSVSAGTLELRTLVEDLRDADPCEWDPVIADGDSATEVAIDSPFGVVGIALSVCDVPGAVSLELSAERQAKSGQDPWVALVEGGCDGPVLAEGPLSSVADALDGGAPLGSVSSHPGAVEATGDGNSDGDRPPCIACSPSDPYTVLLRWQEATEATALELEFSATQCRHATDYGGTHDA